MKSAGIFGPPSGVQGRSILSEENWPRGWVPLFLATSTYSTGGFWQHSPANRHGHGNPYVSTNRDVPRLKINLADRTASSMSHHFRPRVYIEFLFLTQWPRSSASERPLELVKCVLIFFFYVSFLGIVVGGRLFLELVRWESTEMALVILQIRLLFRYTLMYLITHVKRIWKMKWFYVLRLIRIN